VETADTCHLSSGARIPEIPFFCGACPSSSTIEIFLANYDISTILLEWLNNSWRKDRLVNGAFSRDYHWEKRSSLIALEIASPDPDSSLVIASFFYLV
jgi:hypothetical protein